MIFFSLVCTLKKDIEVKVDVQKKGPWNLEKY